MPTERRTIALVSADQETVAALTPILEEGGYRVVTGTSALEGIGLLKHEGPALVIVDPRLPGSSTKALLNALHAERDAIPLFILATEVDAFAWLVDYPIAGLVVQPFDPPILLMHLAGALGLEEASQSIEESIEEIWRDQERSLDEGSEPEQALALVVEEEAAIAAEAKATMERLGMAVLVTADGEEGLHIAQERFPNIVLLSTTAPKLSGHQLCRLIKFNRKYRDMRIVLLTRKNDAEDERQARRSGAEGTIAKPFQPEALATVVREAMHMPQATMPQPTQAR